MLVPLKKLGHARKRCELWDGLNITMRAIAKACWRMIMVNAPSP
jgi:hypothetical protein